MPFRQEITNAYNKFSEFNPLSTSNSLAIGAALQVLSFAFLPSTISNLLPLLYLGFCLLNSTIRSKRIFKSSFTTLKRGRWTAELPKNEDAADRSGVVMFVLGTRFNHPFGPLAPGAKEIGEQFEKMWLEAEQNREKWGYLGRTATLRDTADSEGMTMIWLSYWKNLKALQEFSTSALHRAGEISYNAKKYPYTGIMHETYHAPPGSWESIYDNMPPWGLGKVGERLQTLHPKSSGIEHSSMFNRMRKNMGENQVEL